MPVRYQPSPLVRWSAIVAIVLLVALGSFVPGEAQGTSLAGTWRVTQSAGGQSFFLLMDFSTGGAAHYTDQGNSSGVGVWRKDSGANHTATFEEFADCDNNGTTDCRLRFRAAIQLSGGSGFVGTVVADILSLDGTQVQGSFGSASLIGTRMVVVP